MPTWEPYLTVRAVLPVVAGLEALGHPVARILTAAEIERSRLDTNFSAVFPIRLGWLLRSPLLEPLARK